MNNLWLKLKIWTKIAVAAVALVYIVIFAVNNSENPAKLWFFFGSGSQFQTTVLKLVLFAFLAGVLVTVLIRTAFRTIGQIRELKERQSTERREREIGEIRTKAGMLRERAATHHRDPQPIADNVVSAPAEPKL